MSIDGVRFKKAQKVIVEGKAEPGAVVTVENKSLAPFAPPGTADTFTRGEAGADGSFAIEVPAGREGDQLQLKAQSKGVLSVLGVRLQSVEAIDLAGSTWPYEVMPAEPPAAVTLLASEPDLPLLPAVPRDSIFDTACSLSRSRRPYPTPWAVLTIHPR